MRNCVLGLIFSLPAVTSCLVSLGVCALHGKATVQNTLRSFRTSGLEQLVDEIFVFYQNAHVTFSDGTSKEKVVRHFGYKFYGDVANSGFMCIQDVVNHAKCKYLIFVEEDFAIYSNQSDVSMQLRAATQILQTRTAHVIRLRSRHNSGAPNYALHAFRTQGSIAATHLLHSVHWSHEPERKYPGLIWKCYESPPFWCAKSSNADFTLNPIMFEAGWWQTVIRTKLDKRRQSDANFNPDSHFHFEWGMLNLTIAAGDGIFTHERLDRN